MRMWTERTWSDANAIFHLNKDSLGFSNDVQASVI